jgi:hypothetical protein
MDRSGPYCCPRVTLQKAPWRNELGGCPTADLVPGRGFEPRAKNRKELVAACYMALAEKHWLSEVANRPREAVENRPTAALPAIFDLIGGCPVATRSPLQCVGAWRSLVAHWSRGPGVVGSNPIAPTIAATSFSNVASGRPRLSGKPRRGSYDRQADHFTPRAPTSFRRCWRISRAGRPVARAPSRPPRSSASRGR